MKKAEHAAIGAEEKQCGSIYCTADGLAFLEEFEALQHANGLADTTVKRLTREEVDAEICSLTNGNWHEQMEELLIDLDGAPEENTWQYRY